MRTVNSFIGSPIERLEDLRFLRGRGQYVDDVTRKDVLHAAILRSSVAHGRIRAIDTTAALALPGVHAVITAQGYRRPRAARSDAAAAAAGVRAVRAAGDRGRQGALCRRADRARARRQRRASPRTRSALIEVDIEPLPAVADRACCRRGTTSLLFEEPGTNLAITFHAVRGDAAAAFKDAPYVRREQLPHPAPHRAADGAARPARRMGRRARQAHRVRRRQGAVLQPPHAGEARWACRRARSTSIENDVGGGFGARGEFYPEDFLIPFAARHTGRPVKWTEDRREHLMCDEPRARGGVRHRDRLHARRHDPGAARPRLCRRRRLYAHQRRGRRRATSRSSCRGPIASRTSTSTSRCS